MQMIRTIGEICTSTIGLRQNGLSEVKRNTEYGFKGQLTKKKRKKKMKSW